MFQTVDVLRQKVDVFVVDVLEVDVLEVDVLEVDVLEVDVLEVDQMGRPVGSALNTCAFANF